MRRAARSGWGSRTDGESHFSIDFCVEEDAASDSWREDAHPHLRLVRDPPREEARQRRMPLEDLTREGRAWLRRIEPNLHDKNEGSFIAIDVDAGDFVLGGSITDVVKAARAKLASVNIYVGRIGAPAAYTLHSPR